MRTALVMALVVTSLGCEEFFDDSNAASPNDVIAPVRGTDSDPASLTAYDDVLAGYGTWSEDDTYGTVWTPADPTFVPYATHGRFVNLEGNVVWLSELPWGVTLHHGRWVTHDGRWHWVPGLRYASAWVTWSHVGSTTSWSPVPPTLIWRNGSALRIDPPEEPVVGSAEDGALAIVPSAPTYARRVADDGNGIDDGIDENNEFVRRWLAPTRSGW